MKNSEAHLTNERRAKKGGHLPGRYSIPREKWKFRPLVPQGGKRTA
jgi:hypothetical protein